jgi:hypothetical protein
MLSQESTAQNLQIQIWPIDRLVFYARNPRQNDVAVDRMCSSIREFGFKIPVLARSNGEVVDGHLRLKAARKLGSWPGGDTGSIPVISPPRPKIFGDLHGCADELERLLTQLGWERSTIQEPDFGEQGPGFTRKGGAQSF